jgi:hypothetical protein
MLAAGEERERNERRGRDFCRQRNRSTAGPQLMENGQFRDAAAASVGAVTVLRDLGFVFSTWIYFWN